ncbi:hypothetical protein MON38_18490 [Hymenobacter sp. DH14]|uniref:Uncharacterized protein n=1 Tax=Hymenobacter cyanobacteriorum TaxID=2926463 RepID=A0A9X1VNH6_9BACT|nr:hypothetical protein [Hymenobacter cyanobacteriorum]MCI1189416.1 hypothetical protein [Hymenobacter cyanobacteriorum]
MKIRYVLLLLFGLIIHGAAIAQTAPAPMSNFANVPLTRQDTARAVHELFQSRRGGGFGWLAFGGAGMAASIIPAQQSTSAGVWTPGVVIGSALALLGTKKVIQFGWGREHRVLRDLAATGHLPADVKRRLRGNFAPLHGTASSLNPLLALEGAPAAPVPVPPMPSSGKPAAAPVASVPPVATATTPAATAPLQALADARQDTLDAVLGLFLAKRLGGQLPILLALPGLRLMTGATQTNNSTSPYGQPQSSAPPAGQVALGLALTAGGVAYMFIHNAPYSDAKFDALRTSYLAGTPLPPALRTQLKIKHMASGRTYRERLERRAARRRR